MNPTGDTLFIGVKKDSTKKPPPQDSTSKPIKPPPPMPAPRDSSSWRNRLASAEGRPLDMENGNGAGEHSATELLDVERLTTALSADWLEQHAVLPLRLDGDTLSVGTWLERVDPLALDDLRLLFGAEITLERFSEHDLRTRDPPRLRAGRDDGGRDDRRHGGRWSRALDADEIPLDDLLHLANEAPVVRLVNLLLIEALDARASDVHLEGYPDGLRVRYRVDGVLQNAPSPPPHLTAAIISRIKIMAELDIAERRLPQDGRIRLRLQNRQVDVRVSTVPTLRGESVVLRLLDKERGRISLTELGMAADTLELFTEVISRPHGIVLVTGPTGSGKTTTLYAAVEMIRTGREKILTVEDPVEYELAGVPQVPGERKSRRDVRDGAARAAAPGPRHHSRRRNPRPRNGADRDAGGAHRPPRALDAAHQRRADRAHAPARSRRRRVSRREHGRRGAGAAARARDLPELQGGNAARQGGGEAHRHRSARAPPGLEGRAATSAATPATAAAPASTSCS